MLARPGREVHWWWPWPWLVVTRANWSSGIMHVSIEVMGSTQVVAILVRVTVVLVCDERNKGGQQSWF